MSAFDVWIIRFDPGESSPAERLQAAFGIDAASAVALEQSLPKVVKHGLSGKAAGEMRQALEAIGAVVECRPARDAKRVAGHDDDTGRAAVFHPPGVDLFPAGRISAIDPFAPATEAGVPRISVEDPIPAIPASRSQAHSDSEQPRRITASLLATSHDQQRRKYMREAAATIGAGIAILAIGWFLGNSVLRGEADWIGIAFDGLGIYFLGVGAFDLATVLRG